MPQAYPSLPSRKPPPRAAEAAPLAAIEQRDHLAYLRQMTEPADVLAVGWAGAALAGGTFPTVVVFALAVWRAWLGTPIEGMELVITLALALTLGLCTGLVYAGMVGLFVFVAVGLVARFCQLLTHSIHTATIAGGMTGMLCVTALTLPFSWRGSGRDWTTYLPIATAIVMGQLGAFWSARRRVTKVKRLILKQSVKPLPTIRLSLNQLFRITTFACVTAAVLAASRLSTSLSALLGFGMAVQAASYAGIFLVARQLDFHPDNCRQAADCSHAQ